MFQSNQGDPCQLTAVCLKSVFSFNETETMEGFISKHLWRKFRLTELDHVMCQDDEILVNVLSNIRVGEIDQNVEHIIKSKFIKMIHVVQVMICIFLQKTPQLRDTMIIN